MVFVVCCTFNLLHKLKTRNPSVQFIVVEMEPSFVCLCHSKRFLHFSIEEVDRLIFALMERSNSKSKRMFFLLQIKWISANKPVRLVHFECFV